MTEPARAKIFMHGRSQAVRLPKDYRFPGKEVRVTRQGRGVLLEPIEETEQERRAAFDAWVATWQGTFQEDFFADGREQPSMPDDDDLPAFG